MAITLVIGVCVAYRQLGEWKRETKSKRSAEIAEELIARVYAASDAIDLIRTPVERVEESDDSRLSVMNQKLERIQKFIPEFDNLRRSQVLARALVDSQKVNDAVEEIFDVRQEVYAAIETLQATHRDGAEPDIDKDFAWKLEMKMYATKGKHDELWPRQQAAIKTIESELYPIVRMEA